jgi:hypothetical protein
MTENLSSQKALDPTLAIPNEGATEHNSLAHTMELATLDEARKEWNESHGTHLEAHNDALTAEQAQRVNDAYDTGIYVGTHGPSGGVSPDHPRAKSIQYDEVATIIGDMQPGDALFVEGFGFTTPTYEPNAPGLTVTNGETAVGDIGDMTPMLDLIMRSVIEEVAKNAGTSMAELQRQAHAISAWGYAEKLAAEKGIPVVYADLDAFQVDRFKAIAGGKSLRELSLSPNPADRALADRIDTVRVRGMRNIVKDWAVGHLPPIATPAPDGRKSRLVVFEGRAHREKLAASFIDIGMHFKLRDLSSVTSPK